MMRITYVIQQQGLYQTLTAPVSTVDTTIPQKTPEKTSQIEDTNLSEEYQQPTAKETMTKAYLWQKKLFRENFFDCHYW